MSERVDEPTLEARRAGEAVRELPAPRAEPGYRARMKRGFVEGSLAELGKTAGSDRRKRKATYPDQHGLEASRVRAKTLIEDAKAALAPLGRAADPIRGLADFVFERRS